MIITIDGPVASGKSTVAKTIADKLGFYYLYTGLLYRALAYIILHNTCTPGEHIDPEEFSRIVQDLTRDEVGRLISQIEYSYKDGAPVVTWNNTPITHFLTQGVLDEPASIISSYSEVRSGFLPLQRTIGGKYDIVADGRDCGTIVFPDAEHKFYLTADVSVRAQRYRSDPKRSNENLSLQEAQELVEQRDDRDMNRDVAPLTIPEDGLTIDNSSLNLEQTAAEIIGEIDQNH